MSKKEHHLDVISELKMKKLAGGWRRVIMSMRMGWGAM
jgi:hypothetical protein